VLPDSLKKKIKWFQPEMTCFVSPAFNEPLLSAAFSSWDASGKREGRPGTRLAISDDRGQMFDPVLNYMGNNGVFEARAFPRRGKELQFHLMDGDESLARFRISNPCPGPHPRWKAAPIPAVVTNGGLEITLEKFTTDGVGLRTRCVFLIRENGQESTEWLPVTFEVSDATGNHWRPGVDPPLKAPTGNVVVGCFLGALWPEEDAWKLRVGFEPANKESRIKTTCIVEFLTKPEQVTDDAKPN
jgi:hypothetical protein